MKFQVLCEAMDIAIGDCLENIVSRALQGVIAGTGEVFDHFLPGVQKGE